MISVTLCIVITEGAKVFADSRGKSLQTLEVITPEFRFESLNLSEVITI